MKIKFRPMKKFSGLNGIVPVPASKTVPTWYSTMPNYVQGDKDYKVFQDGTRNGTVKNCSPFLDTFLSGYMICLSTDVLVSKNPDGTQSFTWHAGGTEIVSSHSSNQITDSMIPNGFSKNPFKFGNNWSVGLPKGYSALITHPLNRLDLPFITLSGIVDLDTYTEPAQFPFFLRNDFYGIIEAGTPIAQILPIKRDSWEHTVAKYDEEFALRSQERFFSKLFKPYKVGFWSKKEYR